MAAIEAASFNLTGDGGEPERLAGVRTTSNLFATIGLAPLLGRTFVPDDDAGEPVVVVSEGFWLRRLGGDPAAVGRTITLMAPPIWSSVSCRGIFVFRAARVDVFVPTVLAPEVLAQLQLVLLVSRREAAPGRDARSGSRRDGARSPRRSMPRARTRPRHRRDDRAAARARSRAAAASSPTSVRRCWRCSVPSRSCC